MDEIVAADMHSGGDAANEHSGGVAAVGHPAKRSRVAPDVVAQPIACAAPPASETAKIAPSCTPAVASEHPFGTDAHDHAETPLAAYADIEPFLHYISLKLKSNKAKLRLYDPYFCEGSAIKHLNTLGFARVHNVNEDFYAVVASGRTPAFDVLVTNPPFSGNHMERFLAYTAALPQPWFALMPQFVANKRYFHAFRHACVAAGREPPFYVGPTGRAYTFTAPATAADGSSALVSGVKGRRALPDGVRVFAGKFQCVWFCSLGAYRGEALAWWRRKYAGRPGVACAIAEEDPVHLPQLVLVPKPAPAERRWRKKARRLHQQLAKAVGGRRLSHAAEEDEPESAAAGEAEPTGGAAAAGAGRADADAPSSLRGANILSGRKRRHKELGARA